MIQIYIEKKMQGIYLLILKKIQKNTKGIIKIRQYNGRKKKDKKTNNVDKALFKQTKD